jgi:hypothetical protein
MKRTIFTLLMMAGIFASGFSQNVLITEINYNNPGTDDYEFIEFYNKGTTAVQLEGWTISNAINFTFPSYSLAPGAYVVVASDAPAFLAAFGVTALDWDQTGGNVLNNTSENIVLSNAGMVVDSVHYADTAPWPSGPSGPDGFGPSLVLCDYDSNNDLGENWAAASTPTGFSVNNIEILANPGAASNCATGPIISFQFSNINIQENAGDVFVNVTLTNGNANPTSVTISADAASTATAPGDYTTSLPVMVTFPGGMMSATQTVTISVVDDSEIEQTESLILKLSAPTNGATIVNSTFTLNITDNDTPSSGSLLISGVFDAQPGAAGAKGVELKALQAIPDLSIYGIGSASNGGGTDGQEITLPAGTLAAGECIYIAADSALFATYFGINSIANGAGASINGDDAIELFENGAVIDVFGDITYTAGSGPTLPWNYLDGWAYRKDGTGPDGALFNLNNWTIAANALNGGTSNATAPNPFPVCEYSPVAPMTAELSDDNFTVPFGMASNLNVLTNDVLPVAITSMTIVSGPSNGTATVNGLIDITYTPSNGYCGPDAFTYQVCDAGGCDQATVTLTVECPVAYPAYNLGAVTTVTNGVPDSMGVTAELQGTVYGIDYQGVNAVGTPLPAVQFYINDGTGSISVFGSQNFGYVVKEGDKVKVRGEIGNFNCLTQVSNLDTIIFVSANNPLLPPSITTFLNESFESELVQFTNMAMVNPADWNPGGTGFNVRIKSVINPTADTIIMRIDNDCALFNMPAPTGTFHAIGIGGQFVSGGAACVSGYQFLPRFASDIILLNSTNESFLAGKISFYPNPVSDQLLIKSDIIIDDVIVANAIGQQVLRTNSPGERLDVSQLEAGLYLISFRAGGEVWTSKFVKQ